MRRLACTGALALLALAPAAQAWTWPASGPVLRPFTFGVDPYSSGQHRGIDVSAPADAVVPAPASGTVTFAGSVPTSGRSVTIQTADGYAVTLTHLGALLVMKGVLVAEGEGIGTIGPSGVPEVPEPYVHLGVRVAADPQGYVNPLSLLPPPPGACQRPQPRRPSCPPPPPAADPPAAARLRPHRRLSPCPRRHLRRHFVRRFARFASRSGTRPRTVLRASSLDRGRLRGLGGAATLAAAASPGPCRRGGCPRAGAGRHPLAQPPRPSHPCVVCCRCPSAPRLSTTPSGRRPWPAAGQRRAAHQPGGVSTTGGAGSRRAPASPDRCRSRSRCSGCSRGGSARPGGGKATPYHWPG